MFRPSEKAIREKLIAHNKVLDGIVEEIAQTPTLSENAAKKYGYGVIDDQAASLERWRNGAEMILMEYYDVIVRGEALADGDVTPPDRNMFINRELVMLQLSAREHVLEKHPEIKPEILDVKLKQAETRLLELSGQARQQLQGFVQRHYERPQEGKERS